MAKKIEVPENTKELPLAIVNQMITLSTAGFGLVAALAWNEVVKAFVEAFIKPYLPVGSTFVSLFIYAIIVTMLAVSVTLQLARVQKRLQAINDRLNPDQTAAEEVAKRPQKTSAKKKKKTTKKKKRK